MPDFYKILGVNKNADAEEIKNAYRNLAKKYHPDKNPGDAEAEKKFKEINAAYDILKDEQKRTAYDRYGEAAFTGSAGGPRAGAGGFNFSGSFSDIFEDLFSNFTSGNAQAKATVRGADLRYNMEISLEEAYHGDKKTIKVPTYTPCETCESTGSADKIPGKCQECNGIGKIRAVQGFFTIERTCTKCGGSGTMIKNKCKKCGGQGRIHKEKTLSVNIPAGVEEGTRIRLTGEGEAAPHSGEPGDLYIFISLKPHSIFIREGNDIHCRIPLSFTTAALGGHIEVPTLDKTRAKITIPEGTQTGHKFRLAGKGMPIMRSTRFGDMYVHVSVEIPVNLSKKQRELLQELEKLSDRKTNPESEAFSRKIKDFIG